MSGRQLLILPVKFDADIDPYLICKPGTTSGSAALATQDSDLLIGVTSEVGGLSGKIGDLVALGITPVRYGATCTFGELLTADATGKAIPAGDGDQSVGICWKTGGSGEIGQVLVLRQRIDFGSSVTASAAEINVLDGIAATLTAAELSLLDGVTATTAELNKVDSAIAYDFLPKVEKITLAAVDTAGGVFAWTPAAACIVTRVIIDVTTQSTAACSLDIGVAANATTLSDTLIDGLSLAAAGIFDSIENNGTNGATQRKVAAGQSVTGSVASGASAGLVGSVYIHFHEV